MEFNHRGSRDRRVRPDELPWDRILLVAPLVIVVIMVALLAYRGVYRVEPHEEAVVLRFGKYHATVGPGLHGLIPLVDEVVKVSTEEQSMRLPLGIHRGRPRDALEDEALMVTGDLNAALVQWTIQWKWSLDSPDEFLQGFYREQNPQYMENVISTVARTAMNRVVGDYSIGEVLAEKSQEIENEALDETREFFKRHPCGVTITGLQLQRVTPPEKVKPAFEEVIASVQTMGKLKAEAEKEQKNLRNMAYAAKEKSVQEAEGYAARRRAEAEGEIEALESKFREYKSAPEETRKRLYLEAMEEVFGAVQSKVIVDADLQERMLPLLPLDQGAKP